MGGNHSSSVANPAMDGSMSADNMTRNSPNLNVGETDPHVPNTSTPNRGINQDSIYGNPGSGSKVEAKGGQLPSIVSDENVYRLTDLVNSDFSMPVTDKDFELSHE